MLPNTLPFFALPKLRRVYKKATTLVLILSKILASPVLSGGKVIALPVRGIYFRKVGMSAKG